MKKDTAYVLLSYILWGVFPIFWKLLGSLDPVYVLATRLLWSLIFCWLIAVVKKNTAPLREILRSPRQVLYFALCGAVITVNWGFYISAVSAGHVIEGSLAYFMCPIFSVLMGFLFYREKLDLLQWLAVALAAIGVLIPVIRYGKVPLYALVIGISFAAYSALKKKVTVASDTSMVMETLPLVPLALAFLLWQETHGNSCTTTLSGWQYLLLPLTGVFTSVPLLLFARGIRGTSLTVSGIIMYINPVLQLLVGVLLYREKFTVENAITFGFVLAAVLLFFGRQWLLHRKGAAVTPCEQ